MHLPQHPAALLAFVGAAWASQGRFKILGNLPEHRPGDFRVGGIGGIGSAEIAKPMLWQISKDFKSTLNGPHRTDRCQESCGMLWGMHLNANASAGFKASIL